MKFLIGSVFLFFSFIHSTNAQLQEPEILDLNQCLNCWDGETLPTEGMCVDRGEIGYLSNPYNFWKKLSGFGYDTYYGRFKIKYQVVSEDETETTPLTIFPNFSSIGADDPAGWTQNQNVDLDAPNKIIKIMPNTKLRIKITDINDVTSDRFNYNVGRHYVDGHYSIYTETEIILEENQTEYSFIHKFTLPGLYHIQVTGGPFPSSDPWGMAYVYVPGPKPPKVDENYTICKNNSTTLTAKNLLDDSDLDKGAIEWYRANPDNTITKLTTTPADGKSRYVTVETGLLQENTTFYAMHTWLGLETQRSAIIINVREQAAPDLGGDRSVCLNNDPLDAGTGSGEADYESYEWFKDGVSTGNTTQFFKVTETGHYKVKVNVADPVNDCYVTSDEVLITVIDFNVSTPTISISTAKYTKVLSATTGTYTDTWLIDAHDEDFAKRHALLNNEQGVWRPEGGWAYNKERSGGNVENINLKTDGVFELEMLNWNKTSLNAIPTWLKTNTITGYNDYGFEIENKDILDRKSAALYGYSGQLSKAVGANMGVDEMAFTSFEDDTDSGNWMIRQNLDITTKEVKIIGGNGNLAIVDMPYQEVENTEFLALYIESLETAERYIYKNITIACLTKHKTDPNLSIVSFAGPEFESTESTEYKYWRGKLIEKVEANITSPQVTYSETVAHTGKRSLHLGEGNALAIRSTQKKLKLKSGKGYVFSGWVSENKKTLTTANLSSEITINVGFTNGNPGIAFTPSGPIIEGWQKVEGTFTMPQFEEDEIVYVTFTIPKGTIENLYLDDFRLFPEDGNMKSYVYDPVNFRLSAVLDNNNFATLYYYDAAGNLFLTKKETVKGIKTIQESISHSAEQN